MTDVNVEWVYFLTMSMFINNDFVYVYDLMVVKFMVRILQGWFSVIRWRVVWPRCKPANEHLHEMRYWIQENTHCLPYQTCLSVCVLQPLSIVY